MNDIARIDSFIKTLSTERFDRYLGLTDGNTDQAVALYACNARLSQALYIPLQVLEVTLRNSIHERLQSDVGAFWFDDPNLITVKNQLIQIGEAKAKLSMEKKKIVSGGVVAALSFGFWTSMFKPDYEELWRHNLYKIVLAEKRKGITRKTFSGPLEPIRKIRNRVAHHECIIELDLQSHCAHIKHLVGLLAPEAKYWMEQNSVFENEYKRQKNLLDKLHGKESDDTRANTGT